MNGGIEDRLKDLGIVVPEPSVRGANHVPVIWEEGLIFNTGQLGQWNGQRRFIGTVGREFDMEVGRDAVRPAAPNVLAQLRVAVDGDLDTVSRVRSHRGLRQFRSGILRSVATRQRRRRPVSGGLRRHRALHPMAIGIAALT